MYAFANQCRSSDPLTSGFALEIPELTKVRDWATREAEEAKRRARDKQQDEEGLPGMSPGETNRPDHYNKQRYRDDPEIYRQFAEYEQQKAREREDRKARERAAFLQAEEESKRRKEEEARLLIEQKAVEEYKRIQQEQQDLKAARQEQLKNELSALKLDPGTVDSILGINSLDFQSAIRPSEKREEPAKLEEASRDTSEGPRSRTRKRSRFGLSFPV